MPRYLYQTEGFIVGSRAIGDGSRLLDVATDKLSRILILAQGARESRSKLRYQLGDLNFFRATLVRGREFWRLVGAEPVTDFAMPRLIADAHCRVIVARLALLIRRFLAAGESPADGRPYAEIRSAISFLARHRLSPAEREQYEIAAVWRFLAQLGYGRRTPTLETILSPAGWSRNLLMTTAACRTEAVASINEALYHSQLWMV